MIRTYQEIPARKISAPRFNPDFDTVLPDTVRAELALPPKRPRILGTHPKSAPTQLPARHWLLLVAVLLALGLVASLSTSLRHQETNRPAVATHSPVPLPSLPPVQASPTPQAEPHQSAPPMPEPSLSLSPRGVIPAPAPEPTPDWNRPSVTVLPQPPRAQLLSLPAPRAALVTSPAPRAKLLQLPANTTLHEGDQTTLTLPYGIQTLVTVRGYRQSFDQLPLTGNQLGDLYIVGQERTPWVFVVTPGTNFPQWVDP
jgi:hypothetical protein